MRLAWLLAAIASGMSAQDLDPEVLQRARIRLHLSEEVARVPNYTCLETVARYHKESWMPRMAALDVVRLEIVYSNGHEWYGSPGERKLGSDNPVQLVGSGMIGNGAFGMALHNVLASADLTFRGEGTIRGRPALRYEFRIPRLLKALTVTLRGGKGTVGEEGSFWVDAQTLDAIRIESRVAEIPAFLPLRLAESSVNYARMKIGDTDVLLAQQATLHMVEESGSEGYDRLDFTHCRSFSAQSAVHFETEEQAATKPPAAERAATPSVDGPDQAVPAFLPVTLVLANSISDEMAVGTLIAAKVAGDVRHKGKVVIADGAAARGRIRRLERFDATGLPQFLVGLEFTEVDGVSGALRFYADFLRIDKNRRVRVAEERVPLPNLVPGREQKVVIPELPGVASLFVDGKSFTLPAGFRMVWRTRGIIHQ